MRAGLCAGTRHVSVLFFLLCLLQLLAATDTITVRVRTIDLLCMFGHDVCVYALCVCSVYVQPRYNSNRAASLGEPLLALRDGCAMIRQHAVRTTTVLPTAVRV